MLKRDPKKERQRITIHLQEHCAEDLRPNPKTLFQYGFAVVQDSLTAHVSFADLQAITGPAFIRETDYRITPASTTFEHLWQHERAMLIKTLYATGQKNIKEVHLLSFQTRYERDQHFGDVHFDFSRETAARMFTDGMDPKFNPIRNHKWELYSSRRAWSVSDRNSLLPVHELPFAVTPTLPNGNEHTRVGNTQYLFADCYKPGPDSRFPFHFLADQRLDHFTCWPGGMMHASVETILDTKTESWLRQNFEFRWICVYH